MRGIVVLGFMLLVGCGAGQIESGPGGLVDAPEGLTDAPAGAARLDVTFSTTTRNGVYAPANSVVAWVETNNGAFVRTVDRKAAVRATHLIAWKTAAGGIDTDAVSGASRANHTTPITFSWDLQDNGVEIPDGTYTLRLEMTEDNSTTIATNSEGTFVFVKGPNAQMQTGMSNNGFTNVTINFAP